MIKKYLYAGLVLLVVAVVVFYILASNIAVGTPTKVANLTVLNNRIGDVPVQVNSTAVSMWLVFVSGYTNIYLLNQSTFTGLSGYLNGNSSASAYSYVQAHNVNKSDVFLNSSGVRKENYPTSQNVSAGNYSVYAVIDSTSGSPSSNSVVNATVVYVAYGYSTLVKKSGELLIAIAAFILAVALLIYGALKKPKVAVVPEAQIEETPKVAKRRKK